MSEETLFKTIYCANCQAKTDHVLTVDDNGETVATCSVCGRALKFPASIKTKKEFNDIVAKHELTNKGQVVKEKQMESIKGLADKVEVDGVFSAGLGLSDAPAPEEPIVTEEPIA